MRVLALLFLGGCFGLEPVPGKPDSGETDTATGDDTGAGVLLGALEVTPGAVDFGNVPVGEYRSEELVLSNTGEGVVRVEASLDGDATFSLSEADIAIAGGTDSVLVVGFTPLAETGYSADLTLLTDSGDSIVVPVAGAGGDGGGGGDDTGGGTTPGSGALTVTPDRYDFGQVDLGDTETTSFTVRNDGTADVLLSNIVAADSAFTVTGGTVRLPQVLSPGASKTVDVAFTPTAERAYSTDLDFQSDDPSNPHLRIALEGEGADLCDVCSGLISVDTGGDPYAVTDFYSLLGTPDRRTWTISNIGDMDLEVYDVYVNNDSLAPCGTFTLTFSGATTLAPGRSVSFQISYAATDVCLDIPQAAFDMNVVHILTDDPSQGDYVIEVGGSRII